jgi:16S rRNA (uracil1498-N3)-methyltransferase
MQFTYFQEAGKQSLKIDGELYKYLFKIRREKSDKEFAFRNLLDDNIYFYKVISINRRDAILELVGGEKKVLVPHKALHIGWCIIDPKNIENSIASLNELGVSHITFIRCQYSQKKYKINYEKLTKLLQNSSSQSGRSNIIKLDESNSISQFIKQYPNSYMFNFSSNNINSCKDKIDTIIVGCEGGFSEDELKYFSKDKIVGTRISTILKSETATLGVASAILL